MEKRIEEDMSVYGPKLMAYDINATFCDGQPGRIERRIVDKWGEYRLDTSVWEAGDVAYQCLKQLYPNGITATEFANEARDFHFKVCDEIYPLIMRSAEAGKLDITINGGENVKEVWVDCGWCGRVMIAFEYMDLLIASGANFANPLNTVLPLVLLQNLDDAVIRDALGGGDLPEVLLEIGALKDRISPPNYVQRIIETSRAAKGKLESFKQARLKGADAIHTENRAMKAEVFQWLDAQSKFKSNEAAATAITGRVPIAHVTARDWFKEWKKQRSASTP